MGQHIAMTIKHSDPTTLKNEVYNIKESQRQSKNKMDFNKHKYTLKDIVVSLDMDSREN